MQEPNKSCPAGSHAPSGPDPNQLIVFKHKFDYIRQEKLSRAPWPLGTETPGYASLFRRLGCSVCVCVSLSPVPKSVGGRTKCLGISHVGFLPNPFTGQFVNWDK